MGIVCRAVWVPPPKVLLGFCCPLHSSWKYTHTQGPCANARDSKHFKRPAKNSFGVSGGLYGAGLAHPMPASPR